MGQIFKGSVLPLGETDGQLLVWNDVTEEWELTSNPEAPPSGVFGYWTRTGTVLSPANAGDNITTTGTVQAEQLTSTDDITMLGHALNLGDGSANNISIFFNSDVGTGEIGWKDGDDRFVIDGDTFFNDTARFASEVTMQADLALLALTGPSGLYINSVEKVTTVIPSSGPLGFWNLTAVNGVLSPTVAAGMVDVELPGDLDVDGDITLENSEFISNSTNGIIRMGGAGGTYDNWIDFKFDVFSSVTDLDTSATNFRFQKNCIVGDDKIFGLGDGGDAFFRWKNFASRDCLQLATFVNDYVGSGDSGYITIINQLDSASGNREPAAFSVDPVLRIYSSDATEADDWIEIFHNQTTGVIQCGNGGLVSPCNVRIGSTVAPAVALDVTGDAAVSGSSTLGDNAAVDLVTVNADLIGAGGRRKDTTRITGNTTLDNTHHEVFCDTDGGSFTVTLPAGVDGRTYTIKNVGTSGNIVILTPDGSELLLGENSDYVILDRGDDEQITYETTEGWG